MIELQYYEWNRFFQSGRWKDAKDDPDFDLDFDAGLFIEGFCPICREPLVYPSECSLCNDSTAPLQLKEDVKPHPSCAKHGHWRIKPVFAVTIKTEDGSG